MKALLTSLSSTLARGTSSINGRRLLRVFAFIALFILIIDLLLTARIYTPRPRIPPLTTATKPSPAIAQTSGTSSPRPPIATHTPLSWNATIVPYKGGKPPKGSGKEKLYIASIHWNDGEVLSNHWIPALLDFVSRYGKDNVFISIVESGSWDGTKEALKGLDKKLEEMGVRRSIVLDEKTHEDEIKNVPVEDGDVKGWVRENFKGWVKGNDGWKRRRIPYLAEMRNRAMGPLREMVKGDGDGFRMFEKVVWLNDVVFTADHISNLLQTRNGSYAAVCALDFSVPTSLYDTFATRDSLGLAPLSLSWPFFSSPLSRNSIIAYEPTPVKSCWNGLVVFASAPFYQGLMFRGVEDSLAEKHVEGSECCLVHSDAETYWGEGGANRGVWINPNVRVGYSGVAMEGVNKDSGWPSAVGKVNGVWAMRWQRIFGGIGRWREQERLRGRLVEWQSEGAKRNETRIERGTWCLKDEMQVLVKNGWAHV